jgi:hypothetical protein
MFESPDLLGEGGQLLTVCAQGGNEENMGFPGAKGAQQFGLSNSPAAVQNK